jgi:predicted glycogen debranching enzyme
MSDLGIPLMTVRRLTFDPTRDDALDPSLEWLVTNGLGGYASGPVAGGLTRRYHALLVGAFPPPLGRLVCVNHVRIALRFERRRVLIDHERLEVLDQAPHAALVEFRLENGLPVWRYEIDGTVLERRVVMPHHRNSTHTILRLLDTKLPVSLALQPSFHMRPHEAAVSFGVQVSPSIQVAGPSIEVTFAKDWPHVRCFAHGGRVRAAGDKARQRRLNYIEEGSRGYDATGSLWTPGWIDLEFSDSRQATFIVSTEPWDLIQRDGVPLDVLSPEEARRASLVDHTGRQPEPMVAELSLAADQFVVAAVGHAADSTGRTLAERSRTIIAGYHWFTDWGRDTMISLEGLTLVTGRQREAEQILRMFGRHVQEGLIPNLFPEAERVGLYHTADATLWFFHAIDRYLAYTRDQAFLADLLPTLVDILDHHRRGTRFGIGVDETDGLLRQGADGYALTWMDAKYEGRVVTPRRGKAVEINALWYNALRLSERWLAEAGLASEAERCRVDADRARASFNQRFWNPAASSLFDVVDGEQGDDPACRPNQIFALSLPHAVLDEAHWLPVLHTVQERLLTPFGLRTLDPAHPLYQSQYHGNLHTRDEAYHQGTAWAWLIGAFVDAWLKVYPKDVAIARGYLAAFDAHLNRAGVGSISEIFDAEMPHIPRGCIAQAWSVAEVLRSWIRTA